MLIIFNKEKKLLKKIIKYILIFTLAKVAVLGTTSLFFDLFVLCF